MVRGVAPLGASSFMPTLSEVQAQSVVLATRRTAAVRSYALLAR